MWRVPVRRLAALLLLPGLAAPAAASALPPSDLSDDPLDRGALLALPGLYRLRVDVTVEALVTRDGRRLPVQAGVRRIATLGTAFGVAPGGYVVAAAHVVRPGGESLAVDARVNQLAAAGRRHDADIARRWVRRQGARAGGVRVVGRRLTQADAGQGAGASRSWTPRRVRIERRADLALLRILAPQAPALPLYAVQTEGTPVVTIGYGGEGIADAALTPVVRRGALGRSGTVRRATERTLTAVTTGVERGDSGGPAVDRDGQVRGVVVLRSADGGIVEPSQAIRKLMRAAGVVPEAGAAAARFRVAMGRFWALDFRGAARGFRSTLEAFDDHTLARRQLRRATALQRRPVGFAADGSLRRFLLALAALSAVAAIGCSIALAVTRRRGGGHPDYD